MPYQINHEYQRILKIRKIAKEHGLRYYFTGVACKRGHIAERYTTSGICIECRLRPELKEYIRLQNKNISKSSYERIISYQNECCAICENKLGLGNDQAIDHCHKTNEIRGILCKHCNMGLGNFKDDPDKLRAAARYLENYKTSMIEVMSNK